MKISKLGLVLITVFGTVLGACGAQHDGEDNGTLNSESAGGFPTFQSGLYQFFQSANCVKCHATGGQAPPQYWFAQSDVSTAYSLSVAMIGSNFSSPTTAPWIAYSANNHCSDPACNVPTNQAVVTGLVKTWFAAELASGTTATTAKYLTAGMPIPKNLPMVDSGSPPAVIRFSLTGVNPALSSLNGAILEVVIQLINSTEYRVTAAKIAGNSQPVTVTGIHVYLKTSTASGVGVEDPNQGTAWDSITATAPVFALPNPLPTTPLGATPLVTTEEDLQVQSTSDVMTIGFDNLQ